MQLVTQRRRRIGCISNRTCLFSTSSASWINQATVDL